MAFLPSEDIDNFSLRLASLMQKLEMFGDDDINEEQAVEKLLHIVPDKYTQVTLVVETILDLSALTIEEVTGRLKGRRRPQAVSRRADHRGWQASSH